MHASYVDYRVGVVVAACDQLVLVILLVLVLILGGKAENLVIVTACDSPGRRGNKVILGLGVVLPSGPASLLLRSVLVVLHCRAKA